LEKERLQLIRKTIINLIYPLLFTYMLEILIICLTIINFHFTFPKKKNRIPRYGRMNI